MNGQNMESEIKDDWFVFVIDYNTKSIQQKPYNVVKCELVEFFLTHEEAKEHLVKWIKDEIKKHRNELKITSEMIHGKISDLKSVLNTIVVSDVIEVVYYRHQVRYTAHNFETIQDAVNYVFYGEQDGMLSCHYITVNGVEIYPGKEKIGLYELYNKYNSDNDE